MTYSPKTIRNNLDIYGTDLTLDSDNVGAPETINIIANKGSGNPAASIRYNATNGHWEFSDDGVFFQQIGSGGGTISNAGDLVPAIDDGYRIGMPVRRWIDGYFSEEGLYLIQDADTSLWRISASDGYGLAFDNHGQTELYLRDGYTGIGTRFPSAGLHISRHDDRPALQLGDVGSLQIWHSSVQTTNATPAVLKNISTTAWHTYFVEANIVGRRTGGLDGYAGDSFVYSRKAVYKNVGGALSVSDITTEYTFEDNAAADISMSLVGPIISIRVSGIANYNIDWQSSIVVQTN